VAGTTPTGSLRSGSAPPGGQPARGPWRLSPPAGSGSASRKRSPGQVPTGGRARIGPG